MKRLLTLAALAALAACNRQQPAAGGAVTTTPTEAQKPLAFESAPLTVKADAVKEQDPAILAGATWTRKQCALTLKEVPDAQADVPAAASGSTHLAGFFIDPKDQPAGNFEIVLKGESKNFSIPAKTGWDRSDVAEFFKLPQLANSGYDVNVDLSGVPDGKYKIDYMADRGGTRYFCESGKNLVVASAATKAP